MKISDIAIRRPAELRRVGIVYPDRIHVVDDGIRLLADIGIDCDVSEDNVMSVLVPRASAMFYAGALERFTGRIAFNEWLTS